MHNPQRGSEGQLANYDGKPAFFRVKNVRITFLEKFLATTICGVRLTSDSLWMGLFGSMKPGSWNRLQRGLELFYTVKLI
jgi:hypothetical protein